MPKTANAMLTCHFLSKVNLDRVMIFNREEESVQDKTRERARLMQADGVDERREPAAVIGEIEKLIQVSELELRLESLALPNHESGAFQCVEDLLLVGRTQHHAVDIKLRPAEQPAQKLVIGLGLEIRVGPLG